MAVSLWCQARKTPRTRCNNGRWTLLSGCLRSVENNEILSFSPEACINLFFFCFNQIHVAFVQQRSRTSSVPRNGKVESLALPFYGVGRGGQPRGCKCSFSKWRARCDDDDHKRCALHARHPDSFLTCLNTHTAQGDRQRAEVAAAANVLLINMPSVQIWDQFCQHPAWVSTVA